MEEHEKRQYINVVGAVGIVFIMGILLGNIIVSCMQEKELAIELTTQQEESIQQKKPVMYLEKPQAIKNFLYKGITESRNNETLESKPNIDIDENTSENATHPHKENVNKPTTEPVKENEVDTTIEGNDEVESDTTNIEDTTDVSDEITEIDETIEEVTKEESTTGEETTKVEPLINVDSYMCSLEDMYYASPVREYTSEQKELIAKMLYCEAGGTSWDCQVATCSAIINFIEHYGGDFSVLDNGNKFSPASYYRYKTPTETNYQVLNYVLSGHLIVNIKYFRIYHYHNFGTPMFAIDNVYFSK